MGSSSHEPMGLPDLKVDTESGETGVIYQTGKRKMSQITALTPDDRVILVKGFNSSSVSLNYYVLNKHWITIYIYQLYSYRGSMMNMMMKEEKQRPNQQH